MDRLSVFAPGAASVGEWLERIKDAVVVAVLSEQHEHLLGPLVAQLGSSFFISATRPVGEALKIVAGGMVVETVDRAGVVQPTPPFAFRVAVAQRVLGRLPDDLVIDLLAVLAREATPLHFEPGFAGP